MTKENTIIFICGDFNTTKDESIYHYLSTGVLTPKYRNKNFPKIQVTDKDLKHSLGLKELYTYAHKLYPNEKRQPSYIGNVWQKDRLIDFIFYNYTKLT